jgi:hypothetical protein
MEVILSSDLIFFSVGDRQAAIQNARKFQTIYLRFSNLDEGAYSFSIDELVPVGCGSTFFNDALNTSILNVLYFYYSPPIAFKFFCSN